MRWSVGVVILGEYRIGSYPVAAGLCCSVSGGRNLANKFGPGGGGGKLYGLSSLVNGCFMCPYFASHKKQILIFFRLCTSHIII
jgi:hypothetical protein